MEIATQALTSIVIARAARKRLPQYGTAILAASAIAPDLDYASYFGGASAFLRFNRTLLHSIPSAAALACAIAAGFWWLARKRSQTRRSDAPFTLASALAAAALGISVHLLLDLASGTGARLLWPFSQRWSAWDLAANLDPWILILLAAGLLLPLLFRLVSEEIGDRKRATRGRGGAILTLALLATYLAARASLHSRAVELLLSRDYHARTPLAAGAFPSASSPFVWRGVVTTDNTIEEVEVSLAAGAEFDPEHSLTRYKPDDSPALAAAQNTAVTKGFLSYARFPLASVVRREETYRFEVHDARFASGDTSAANMFVRVELSSDLKIQKEELLFAGSPNP